MSAAKLRVMVLMGGPSSEYDVSIKTGQKILKTLDSEKYLIQPVVITKERRWLVPPRGSFMIGKTPNESEGESSTAMVAREEQGALEEIKGSQIDAAFIAMHGEFGEDGVIQGLLESAGIPYTGSGVLASALGMDKPRASAVFKNAGLLVPESLVLARKEFKQANNSFAERAAEKLGLPLVIKPADRGSSVGVAIAKSIGEIEPGVAHALSHADTVLLERFIKGVELTCGVLETERGLIPLAPTEIIPRESEFFDYHAKYTPGASEEITPPRLPKEDIKRIQATALKAHQAIGCAGMSRTDMILTDDGALYVLEINTIPGMTETSLLPQAAEAVGIPFPKLLDEIISSALRKNLRYRNS